ncbi:MAG: hypothetical protein FJX36_04785 [Alphaproteobacteria bacterium]|nr:hypothetical protein [Alphaproteobacteria bacterium]
MTTTPPPTELAIVPGTSKLSPGSVLCLGRARHFSLVAWDAADQAIERIAFIGTIAQVHRFALRRLQDLRACTRVSIVGNP